MLETFIFLTSLRGIIGRVIKRMTKVPLNGYEGSSRDLSQIEARDDRAPAILLTDRPALAKILRRLTDLLRFLCGAAAF